MMMKKALRMGTAMACLLLGNTAYGAVIWDEAVNGDLSSSSSVVTSLGDLAIGDNIVRGGFSSGDGQDQFSFTVPSGQTLTSLKFTVTGGTGNFNTFFKIGDISSPIVGSTNSTSAQSQNINLLQLPRFAIGNSTLGSLGPGVYSLVLLGFGSTASYDYTLTTVGPTAVPLPATSILLAIGLTGASFLRRKPPSTAA